MTIRKCENKIKIQRNLGQFCEFLLRKCPPIKKSKKKLHQWSPGCNFIIIFLVTENRQNQKLQKKDQSTPQELKVGPSRILYILVTFILLNLLKHSVKLGPSVYCNHHTHCIDWTIKQLPWLPRLVFCPDKLLGLILQCCQEGPGLQMSSSHDCHRSAGPAAALPVFLTQTTLFQLSSSLSRLSGRLGSRTGRLT